MTTRREFIRKGSTAGAFAIGGHVLSGSPDTHIRDVQNKIRSLRNPVVKPILLRGIESAIAAGASYADIRLSHTRDRTIRTASVLDSEEITVGIRSLVKGFWGFASGSAWNDNEIVRLGKESVAQARANTLGGDRRVEFSRNDVVVDGHWETPVHINPFDDIHPDEIRDHIAACNAYVERPRGGVKHIAASPSNRVVLNERQIAFASSEGSYITQCNYVTSGMFQFKLVDSRNRESIGTVKHLSPTGLGWEFIESNMNREKIDDVVNSLLEDIAIPIKPFDAGRYDVVLSAESTGLLTSRTIGLATELDRVRGYEANAGGTSYLKNAEEILGSYKLGSPDLTVTANRNEQGGVATTRWDDEGTETSEVPLVTNGQLQGFQANREHAGWLSTFTDNTVKAGFAYSSGGDVVPIIHTGNLKLHPADQDNTKEDLMVHMIDGIDMSITSLSADFQFSTFQAMGNAYQVKDGRRVARYMNAGLLMRTSELWSNIVAIGGSSQAVRHGYGQGVSKGEPPQYSLHSVTSVPILFKDVTAIDVRRKA